MAKKVKNFVLPNGEEIDISGANEDLSNLSSAGQAKLDVKANDSTVVHKTGNETIAGTKTFTGNPVFSNDAFGKQITVNRTNNTGGYSVVQFQNGGTVKGYLGVDSNGNPLYCNSTNTGYNLVRNSAINTAVGSATKPVYINSSGVATAITSYEGNSATSTKATQDSAGQQINTTYVKGVTASNATITVTKGNGTTSTATINNVANATNATKATQDSSGNQINTSYMPLKYSKYSISTYASSNPYIKLATFTVNNTANYDNSILFWVEILHASNNKAYALCKLSSRWGTTAYSGTNFEILEKYGYSGYFSYFDTLTWAYKYTTASRKGSIIGEIWLKTTNIDYVSYYFRPAECNEYGDYSMIPVSMTSNPWTYYNKSGTSTGIASTAITSGYTQVKVTDKSIRYYEPLLSHRWSDHLLNDIAWLRADTFSWQSGTTYSLAYNELLSEYNNSASVSETEGSITFKRTPKGYKIALANQESAILNKYNTDGIAWYYILDTTNKKFKLPRMKYNYWKDTSTLPVKGNGMTLGLQGSTQTGGLFQTSSNYMIPAINVYGTNVGTSLSGSQPMINGGSVGVTTDPTKSGIVADVSNTIEETGLYLYFYVGEFTKSAEAQTAGLKAEQLNSKVDTSSLAECQVVTETYTNGASGYRIWSDGYCEQWGNFGAAFSSWTPKTVTFLKVFKDTNYVVWAMTGYTNNTDSPCINTKTISSFSCYPLNSTGNACWKACGYLAEGEY